MNTVDQRFDKLVTTGVDEKMSQFYERVRAFLHTEIERARKEALKEVRERVTNMENFYEYTPKEDMFGVGYERAVDGVRTILDEMEKTGGKV